MIRLRPYAVAALYLCGILCGVVGVIVAQNLSVAVTPGMSEAIGAALIGFSIAGCIAVAIAGLIPPYDVS